MLVTTFFFFAVLEILYREVKINVPALGLSQTEGDWGYVSNNFGNVVDSFKIVHYTKEDHSVGRSTDGAADFKLFTNPTPNATNVGAQDFYTPTLVFDLQAGYYPSPINVSIT